jgi:hypothetical protein
VSLPVLTLLKMFYGYFQDLGFVTCYNCHCSLARFGMVKSNGPAAESETLPVL